MKEFQELIENNKDKSLKELAKISGKYAPTTIWRGIKESGFSYKKTFIYSKRDDGLRNESIEKIKLIPKENLVYLDESGDRR